jgi:uncharacterized alpha-E superfamily protein
VLSRIADSLFWLGRYIERAEYTARILDVNYHMLLEQSNQPFRLHWEPLIVMAGEQERFAQLHQEATAQTVFDFLAFREENPSSIVQCIARARENARTIRDRISREMWEDINGLYHTISRFDPQEEMAIGPHRLCEVVKFGGHSFHGVSDATLPHDEGWDFFRIGWALERQEMTARLVDVRYHNLLESPAHLAAQDSHQWMAVLKSVGAYEAYHRQYHSPIEPEKVAEMLILHSRHPRSILFGTAEVQAGLRSISGSGPGTYANEAERLTGKVLQRLRYDKIDEIFKLGLHQYLADLLHMFNAIGDAIARTYFYYGAAA